MIGFLRGNIVSKTAERIILDVGGVGYDIFMPASSLYHTPGAGQTVSLHILTLVREDSIRLFGFAHEFDKKMFESLLLVNGVGPKAALALLGPVEGRELADWIVGNQTARLVSIPGIGSKTAERIVLELKGKLQKTLLWDAMPSSLPSQPLPPTSQESLLEDLSSALANLGYKEKQCAPVLRTLSERQTRGETLSLEAALRFALRELSQLNPKAYKEEPLHGR